MRNAMKVAKWEMKRNLKNKSFLIGLFSTPVLIAVFGFIGGMMGASDADMETETVNVMVSDTLGTFDAIVDAADEHGFDWVINKTSVSEDNVLEKIESTENMAYIYLNKEHIKDGKIPVYTSDDMPMFFMNEVQALESTIKAFQLEKLDLSDEERTIVTSPITFEKADMVEKSDDGEEDELAGGMDMEDIMQKAVPGVFAGIILLSIIFSGMYIFQSASQEKKDKISEIILSSLTPSELMQGKIIGYFGLGMVQAVILLLFAIPFAMWKLDVDVFTYLFVPETLLLVGLAIAGYFLFASIFVGIGATMADMSSAGQFQGMVIMLPFLPFLFIGPVISDPSGLIAQIGTYIPFTAPGVLILRLSMLTVWPWIEIAISLVILAISVWVFMKLAGKIFKVGILMYGKNASPKEIWKWIRA